MIATGMSAKNPTQSIVRLKVLVSEDTDAKQAVQEMGDDGIQRPVIRRDCLPGGCNEERPCPWYSCKHHLGIDVNEDNGSIKVRDVDDLVHSCELDVAEIGGKPGSGKGEGITFEEIGEILDITRTRAQQIEAVARPVLMERIIIAGIYERPPPKREKSSIVSACDAEGHVECAEIPLASDESQD